MAFYSNHLCERGSEIALYDYADFAERLRGATAFVLYDATSDKNVQMVIDRFKARFGCRLVGIARPQEIAPALETRGVSHCYIIKFGHRDEPSMKWFGRSVRTMVHAVFDATEPHGGAYARISPCVPCLPGARPVPVVPHMVRPVDPTGPDLRAELGIPPSATVFGRHGGEDTFDIPEARSAILEVARTRRDIYFVLLNTAWPPRKLCPPNVLHLDPTMDEERKARFIRTCDAMIHARLTGETFGLAVAEFSVANRPVITSLRHHECGAADFHLRTLGAHPRGAQLFYHDAASCARLLLNFDRHAAKTHDWNAYRAFAPERVMPLFWACFVDGREEEGHQPAGGAYDPRSRRSVQPEGAGPMAGPTPGAAWLQAPTPSGPSSSSAPGGSDVHHSNPFVRAAAMAGQGR